MKYLSMAKAKQLVRDAVERHPERLNPMVGATCVYTCPNDPELHCIAGQVLVDAGIPLTGLKNRALFQNQLQLDNAGYNMTGAVLVTKGYMTKETLFFLGRVQQIFDRQTHKNRPWKEALELCGAKGLL